MSKWIDLNVNNVDDEHLCCALGDKKHEAGVAAKKAWLKRRFAEGLVFRKLDVRGKVFIEYAPTEKAWRPVVAPGWLAIHCLWVSGSYTKKGHGRELVESCLADARRQKKTGAVVIVGRGKRPFLGDEKFFKHLGFEVVDEGPEARLLAFRCRGGGSHPKLAASVRKAYDGRRGPFAVRYTDQCPFNAHWAPEVARFVREAGFDVSVEHVNTRARAQRVASPLGAFGLECGGACALHHLNTKAGVQRFVHKSVRPA